MKICPNCHQENPDLAKFCLGCGTSISHLQGAAGSESTDQGERRQMTILFCDLVDSTPLSERMDPEDYRQMILDYHNAAEQVIQRHGGKVGNYLGDGLLVYFGYRRAWKMQQLLGSRRLSPSLIRLRRLGSSGRIRRSRSMSRFGWEFTQGL